MEHYLEIIKNAYSGYANYLWNEITFQYTYKPWWENYFYLLLGTSLIFLIIEWVKPWRKNQAKFRQDFWLDFFYMFFNFFIFSLIIYNAASDVVVNLFNDFLGLFGIENLVAFEIGRWPYYAQFVLLFIFKDFISWNVHRLLHRVPWLWEFHKVHHSVKQMGFAAHLRFHWMETIVYKAIQYIPLAMLGFNLGQYFFVVVIDLAIGHFNHSNITVKGWVKGMIAGILIGLFIAFNFPVNDSLIGGIVTVVLTGALGAGLLGPAMLYIFNSPEMHIWHHAAHLPEGQKYGINYGLSLSVWDWIFGTGHIPYNGRDIELGFPGAEDYPRTFVQQALWGFGLEKNENKRHHHGVMQGDETSIDTQES